MKSKFISNSVLLVLLQKASEDERLALTKILDNTQNKAYSPNKIQEELCQEGGHGLINFFRGEGTGYLDIVDEVLDELNIRGLPSYQGKARYFEEIDILKYDVEVAKEMGIKYIEKAEEKIILNLLEKAYDAMSDLQKKSFDDQMNSVAQQFTSNTTRNLSGTAGLVVLGNMGGFATYTFLTTAMSTLTLGTLGFGAYTAATTFVGLILGPAGWAGLGAATLYTVGKPDYTKLIRLVASIGAIRQRIKYENNTNI